MFNRSRSNWNNACVTSFDWICRIIFSDRFSFHFLPLLISYKIASGRCDKQMDMLSLCRPLLEFMWELPLWWSLERASRTRIQVCNNLLPWWILLSAFLPLEDFGAAIQPVQPFTLGWQCISIDREDLNYSYQNLNLKLLSNSWLELGRVWIFDIWAWTWSVGHP